MKRKIATVLLALLLVTTAALAESSLPGDKPFCPDPKMSDSRPPWSTD